MDGCYMRYYKLSFSGGFSVVMSLAHRVPRTTGTHGTLVKGLLIAMVFRGFVDE